MIKWLIFIAAGFLLYKLFMGDKKRKEQAGEPAVDEKLIADGVLVKDPVCGTYVPKDGDIRVRDGEKVHCFCSYDCRDKFVKQIRSESSKGIDS